ncbi:hypothetical protein LAZ67_3004785 [Cordylochernes scorpioides]|uniref:RRM domain-containing protein n=1 Tax=Cordylochernes scorpioides TaxID=51811 RepID=A0ABY6KAI8_9ARAC|nr:hypothetical protein LAZ67_3004785 [Cordylochernes scorpioides]
MFFKLYNSCCYPLVQTFTPIVHVPIAIQYSTCVSQGFAFINYNKREDAARAIQTLNGFGYDNLILNVEWAKPPNYLLLTEKLL